MEMNNSNDVPTLMTQKDLAEYLGLSEAWCERARHEGAGPKFIRLGGKRFIRYRASDVAEWINSQTTLQKADEEPKK